MPWQSTWPKNISVQCYPDICKTISVFTNSMNKKSPISFDGQYKIINDSSSKIQRPVYKNEMKNRYIFWNVKKQNWEFGIKHTLEREKYGKSHESFGLMERNSQTPWQSDIADGIYIQCFPAKCQQMNITKKIPNDLLGIQIGGLYENNILDEKHSLQYQGSLRECPGINCNQSHNSYNPYIIF